MKYPEITNRQVVTPAWLINIINLEENWKNQFQKQKKPARDVFSKEYNEDNGDESDCGDND